MELDKLNLALTWNNLQHKINTFEFVPGKTPLSTPYHVAGAVVIYLITLGILRLWISGRGALKLRGLASIHNLTLSSFSLVSLVAVLYHIIPIWVNRGVHAISCDPDRDIYGREQGIRVWWKKYITTVQIIQFVWDIAWHVGWYMVVRKSPEGTCGGTMAGFFFSNFVIVSFLALFIHFYIQTYKKPASSRPKTN